MYYLLFLFLLFINNVSAEELWTKYNLNKDINSISNYGEYIWIGTNSGLIRLNRLDSSIKIYTTKDGLPSNIVTSVCTDNNGLVYIGLRDSTFHIYEPKSQWSKKCLCLLH